MNRYPYGDLEVVGFEGEIEDPEVPLVLPAVLAIHCGGPVLEPPYSSEPGFVLSEGDLARDEFARMAAEGRVTALAAPLPARADGCFYAAAGSGSAEYVALTVAHARMAEFSSAKRRLGDRRFLDGQKKRALDAYSLAADASQRAEDYARILICDPAPASVVRLRGWIVQQGKDPDALMGEVRPQVRPRPGWAAIEMRAVA